MSKTPNISVGDWEAYATKHLKKEKIQLLYCRCMLSLSNHMNRAIPNYRLTLKYKENLLEVWFVYRSGLAILLIDDHANEDLNEGSGDIIAFLERKRKNRIAVAFIHLLTIYATQVPAGAMMVCFEYRSRFSSYFQQQGSQCSEQSQLEKQAHCNDVFPHTCWYSNQLPNFMQKFLSAYCSFFDVAERYEDPTLFIDTQKMLERSLLFCYQVEYVGLSLKIDFSYHGGFEWRYRCDKEGEIIDIPIDKIAEFLAKIKKTQRLANVFSPPTFHFDRFFDSFDLQPVNKAVVHQAFQQDYSEEEIELLFATQSDEIRHSIEVIHNNDYLIYRFWTYYVAGRLRSEQDEHPSFYGNTLEEIKEQLMAYERNFLTYKYQEKIAKFERSMQQISHT